MGDGDGLGGGILDVKAEEAAKARASAERAADEERKRRAVRMLDAIYRGDGQPRRWGEKEIKAMRKLWPIPQEELDLIESFYSAEIPRDKDFRRGALFTLLNNWAGEVDRARKFSASAPRSESVRKFLTPTWKEAQEAAQE